MISICIPVYNFDISNLVESLLEQKKTLDCPAEIILIDDFSNDNFKELNRSIAKKADAYIELDHNVGRSAIRNMFVQYAKFDYLLFMDCDSIINSKTFLINYIEAIKNYPNKVIYGGRNFQNKPPERTYRLRWKYGKYVESQSAYSRSLYPNRSFISNNFLIPSKIFKIVTFDESLKGYGHEDTLFGYQLKQKGFVVKHVENATLNGDFDNNMEYIKKNENGIKNLIRILDIVKYDRTFIKDVKLLGFYYKFRNFRPLFCVMFSILGKPIKYLLSIGIISLKAFDFYKLGYLSIAMKNLNQ